MGCGRCAEPGEHARDNEQARCKAGKPEDIQRRKKPGYGDKGAADAAPPRRNILICEGVHKYALKQEAD